MKHNFFCDSEVHVYAIVKQTSLSDDRISLKLRVTEKVKSY